MNNKIIASISECSYPRNFIDYVASIVQKISRSNNKVNFFKIDSSQEGRPVKIIAMKYPLDVVLKGKTYTTPVIIYLPTKFPYDIPTFYIEKQKNVQVNLKNVNVNPNNWQITVPSLQNWNPQTSDILMVIREIQNSFSKVFPYYKASSQSQSVNQGFNPQGGFNPRGSYSQPSTQGFSPQPGSQRYSASSNPMAASYSFNPTAQGAAFNPAQNMPYQSSQPVSQPQGMTPEKIENESKNLIINALNASLSSKVIEEVKRVKEQEEKLRNYQNEFNEQIKSVSQILGSKEKVFSQVKNKEDSLKEQIHEMKQYIAQYKDEEITPENFKNFLSYSKKEDKLMQLIGYEATLEDSLAIFKKMLDKDSTQFETLIKNVRRISQELFQTKFKKEQLLSQLQR